MTTEELIQSTLARVAESSRLLYEDVRGFASDKPKSKTCERHNFRRDLDIDMSAKLTHEAGGAFVLAYTPCPGCIRDHETEAESGWLRLRGVPENMLHCSIDGYRATTELQKSALAACRAFLKKKRGFLVLVGVSKFGIGKTHLAVAIMREMKTGKFITHDHLLRHLSCHYDNKSTPDPIASCQKARLLVLDDVGISRGGRDDLPALHSILNHRYGERLPTVLTTNISMETLGQYLGERMKDRLIESLFSVCSLDGPSRRGEMKEAYLNGHD